MVINREGVAINREGGCGACVGVWQCIAGDGEGVAVCGV